LYRLYQLPYHVYCCKSVTLHVVNFFNLQKFTDLSVVKKIERYSAAFLRDYLQLYGSVNSIGSCSSIPVKKLWEQRHNHNQHNDNKHNDTRQNDTHHNIIKNTTLNMMAVLFFCVLFMLSVIMLHVIMLSVIIQSVVAP
jgi:hypothetical protein